MNGRTDHMLRHQKKWRRVGYVAAIVLIGLGGLATYVFSVYGFPDGYSGGTYLRAEPTSGVTRWLVLDEARTTREQPDLANLLDRGISEQALLRGKQAESAIFWLDERAREAGADGYQSSPFLGVVMWKGSLVQLSKSIS